MSFGTQRQSGNTFYLKEESNSPDFGGVPTTGVAGLLIAFIANKNSQSTTALNHCVDCKYVKQSRRLT